MTALLKPILTAALLVSAFQASSADARQTELRGQVTDSQGRPLVHAQVWFTSHLMRYRSETDREEIIAVTDSEGRFSGPSQEGKGLLVVCAEGYLPEVLDPLGDPGVLRVALQPAAQLSGRVVDSEGKPIQGAEVEAITSSRPMACERSYLPCKQGDVGYTLSDSDGRFHLGSLESGWFYVTASANGYLKREHRVQLPPDPVSEELTLVLASGTGELTGRVLDAEGAPIQGATVRAYGEATVAHGVTDSLGWYRLGGIAEENIFVVASVGEESEEDSASEEIQAIAGKNHLDLTIDRRKWHTLRGRVIGPAGEPVEGVTISGGARDAVSTSDGSFTVRAEDGQTVLLILLKDGVGKSSEPIQVKGADIAGIEIRWEERAAEPAASQPWTAAPDESTFPIREVRGRVVGPKGEPLEAWVDINGGEFDGVTRPDGTFSVRLPDGQHTFAVSAEDHREASVMVNVDGRPLDNVVIRLERGLVLRGQIVGSTPGDVFKLEIQGPESFHARTDQEGAFYCGELGPGDWKVIATVRLPPDYLERKVRGSAMLSMENREASLDLDFRLGSLSLAGRVIGSSPDLQLLSADGAMSIDEIEVSDAGAFQIDHLQPGRYRLRVPGTSIEKGIKVPTEREVVIDLRENPEG